MKFEEARTRKDYDFWTDELEAYIKQIRNNYLDGFTQNADGARGIAGMEIGYVDVEINMYSAAQCRNNAREYDMTPIIEYFCCVKFGDGDEDWESNEYLDYTPKVDWKSDDWKEQLETDMFKALDEYVNKNNLSYDKPNKTTW